MLFFRVLHPRATFREALECVEDDWLRDAGPRKPGLTKKEYFDALFQLADTWCETLEEEEYVSFLDMLYDRVTEPRARSGRSSGFRSPRRSPSVSPTPRGSPSTLRLGGGASSPSPAGRSPVFGSLKSTRNARGMGHGVGHSKSFNFGHKSGSALARMADSAVGSTGAGGMPLLSTAEQPVGGSPSFGGMKTPRS